VRIAVNCSLGKTLKEQGYNGGLWPRSPLVAVKAPVFSMSKLIGVDTYLGPEMKSTGEVMGVDAGFGTAFAKSQEAAYGALPTKGRVFVSVANRDKRHLIFPAKRLADLGFEVLATAGTAEVLRRNGVPSTVVRKLSDGPGPEGEPTIVDKIHAGEVDLIVNTPFGNAGPRLDGYEIRTAAVMRGIPCLTTVQALGAAVQGIEALRGGEIGVAPLQQHHTVIKAARDAEKLTQQNQKSPGASTQGQEGDGS